MVSASSYATIASLVLLIVMVHATKVNPITHHHMTFEALPSVPSSSLIMYCTEMGFGAPVEGNRFALVNPRAQLDWLPVSESVDSKMFPYTFHMSENAIVLILSHEPSLMSYWYIVYFNANASELYWSLCDKMYLTSLNKYDNPIIEQIPVILLSFAFNPFAETPQLESNAFTDFHPSRFRAP